MRCPRCSHEWAPFVKHSKTSKEAGDAIVWRLSGLRRKVYDWLALLRTNYGSTDEEMQDGLGMNPSTQRPRRIELVVMGYVRDSGRTRPTRSNVTAVVWVPVKGRIPPDETPTVTVLPGAKGPPQQGNLFRKGVAS